MKKIRTIHFLNSNRYNNAVHFMITELDDALLERFNIEVTFADMKVLKKQEHFDDFINALSRLFMEYTRGNRPEPLYIPLEAEIISLDDGFVDAYYDNKYASEKDEVLHLTQGFDINKSIITYNIDMPNIIELRFDSLFSKDETGSTNSIWNICDGEVKNLFRESILNKLKETETFKKVYV